MASEKRDVESITVYLRILRKVHDKLQARAKKRGISLAQIIREILEAALTEKREDKAA